MSQKFIEIIDYGTTKNDLIPGSIIFYRGYPRVVFLVGKFFTWLRLDINMKDIGKTYSQYELIPIKNIQII